MSRIPAPRSRIPECCVQKKACCPPGGVGAPGGSGSVSRIPGAGRGRIPAAGRQGPAGGQPPPAMTRTIYAGVSRPPVAAVSKTVVAAVTKPLPGAAKATGIVLSRTTFTGPSASNTRRSIAVSVTKTTPSSSTSRLKAPRQPSRLQRFDATVAAELSRRQAPASTTMTTTTSDTHLLEAVDRLQRAQAAHTFAGAVAAAERAAQGNEDLTAAEEAAAEGARCFQAQLVDVVNEDVPGVKPIQVIGYVGITRPKYPAKYNCAV